VMLAVLAPFYVGYIFVLQVYKTSKIESSKKTIYQAGIFQIKLLRDGRLLQVCACVPNGNKKALQSCIQWK
jgi:hypothetical protein